MSVPDSACTAPPCTYNIGLTPFLGRNTTYMISVFNSSAPVQLIDGVPFSSYVDTNNEVSFVTDGFNAISSLDYYTINVDALFGIPQVYIGLNSVPTESVYTYMWEGSGDITISPSDQEYAAAGCQVGIACPVSILVVGRYASRYYISVGNSETQNVLVDAIPTFAYLAAGSTEYFAYNVTDYQAITVAMTAIAGDPDIYISFTTSTPSITNSNWKGLGLADEVIQIKTTDFGYPPSNTPLPFTMYVAVQSFGGQNSTFSVLAVQQDPYWSMFLIDGQPQASISPPHGFSYFTYIVDTVAPQYLDISAGMSSGSVDFYVSQMNTTDPATGSIVPLFPQVTCQAQTAAGQCTNWVVTPSTYTWSTQYSAGALDYLSLPVSQLQLGAPLFIGVLSTTQDSPSGIQMPARFAVTVSTDAAPLQLQEGVDVAGAVSAGSTRYYQYQITDWGVDVVIVGETLTGAVDIYVTDTGATAGPGNSKWNTTGQAGIVQRDIVYIPFGTLSSNCKRIIVRGGVCTLSIAVAGWPFMSNGFMAHYTISASESGSTSFPQYLADGVGKADFVPYAGYQYYFSYVNIASDESIYVTVQNWQGETEMWINLGPNKTWANADTGSSADIYAEDLGGFETAIITPTGYSSSGPQAAGRQLGEKAVLHADLSDGRKVFKYTPSKGALLAAGAVAQSPEEKQRRAAAVAFSSSSRPVTPAKAAALQAAYPGLTVSSDTAAVAGHSGRQLQSSNNLWCTGCSMYVTIHGVTDATYTLSYSSGDTIVPLADNRPYYAAAPPSGYSYFSFQVSDATAAVRFNMLQLFADSSAYIIVQSPSSPGVLPTALNQQYRLRPWAGQSNLAIQPTDPNFCKSTDGSSTGAPCTYLIALQGLYNRTAYAALTASNDEGTIITPLLDGVGVQGSILEGTSDYYVYTAPAGNGVTFSPIRIMAEAFTGRVEIYVTNSYIPGLSSPSMLPGPNSNACQWKGTNFSSIFIQQSDPCFSSLLSNYTIAVYADTGVAGVTTEYNVVAGTGAFDLEFGIPLTNQVGLDNGNYNYTFFLQDPTQDIVITATPLFGEIGLLVRRQPDNSADTSIPQCNQPAGGAQISCTGYTWFATGVQGATTLYIPAATPCQPVIATNVASNAVRVNSQTCQSDWRAGKFTVTVYVYTVPGQLQFAEWSVGVVAAGQNKRLADGWPALAQTSTVQVCNTRDVNTGACSGLVFQPSGTFFTFSIPDNDPPMDQYLLVEKLCEGFPTGQSTGDCGPDLYVALRSCPASQCTPEDTQPFPVTVQDQSIIVNQATGSMKIPYDSCYPNGQPPLGSTDDCVYYVGVYTNCGSNPNLPSNNCPATQFRITYTDDSGVERVPADCVQAGDTCVLPPQMVTNTNNAVRRYEAFAGENPTEVTAKVYACSGDVNVFICEMGAGSNCNPWSMPGPGNSDFAGTTAGQNNGYFEQDFTQAGLFYMGISSNTAHLASNPLFQLSIATGRGPTLVVPPSAQSPTVTRSGSMLSVSWSPAIITATGQANYNPPNVAYLVVALPTSAQGNYYLTTPCGIAAALADPNFGGLAVQATTTGTAANLNGLSATQSYMLAIVANCMSSTGCLPNNGTSQLAAYLPVSVPSAGPAPGPAPAPGNGGAVAGGIIGSLVAVAFLFGCYKYRAKIFGGSSAADNTGAWSTSTGGYDRLNNAQEWGGDGRMHAVASTQAGSVNAGGDAYYTQL